MAKRSYYRAANAVFDKTAFEEVVIKIVHSKCVPILIMRPARSVRQT